LAQVVVVLVGEMFPACGLGCRECRNKGITITHNARCHTCSSILEQMSNATGEDQPVQQSDDPIVAPQLVVPLPPLHTVSCKFPAHTAIEERQVSSPLQDEADWDAEENDYGVPPPTMCNSPSYVAPPPIMLTMSPSIIEEHAQQEAPAAEDPDNTQRCGPKNRCIYGPARRMEENEVLRTAWWCYYCCCCGLGCTRWPAHLKFLCKCLVCRYKTEYTEEMHGLEGAWSQSHNCCRVASVCHLPPRIGTPKCVCCADHFCGNHKRGHDPESSKGSGSHEYIDTHKDDAKTSDFDFFLHESYVWCYCCCTGMGMTPGCHHLCSSKSKCGCCKCHFRSADPDEGDGDCFLLHSCWWLHSFCRIPPACTPELNPLVSCCGCKCRKPLRAHTIGPHGPGAHQHKPIVDAPYQHSMNEMR